MPQLWSCSFTPVTQLTSQLNTRLGKTLCQGSWRTFFQPLTTSSPPLTAARKRGISSGSSCRSASSVRTTPPRAWRNPAGSAAALPKFRRKRSPRTRGSAAGQFADRLPRAVRAAVVDEDDFAPQPGSVAHRRVDLGDERRQALLLVEHRDDERDEVRVGARSERGMSIRPTVHRVPA